MTLALGFGADRGEAIDTARASLERGFDGAARAYDARLARLRRRTEAAPRERARLRPGLLGVGDGARRQRGQATPRRPHRLAEHALGLGPADDRGALGRVPPGLAARPLSGGHRAARARRQRRGEPAARLHLRAPAEARRLVPAEHARRRDAENWTNLQMDEVALPIVLAWQLRRFEPPTLPGAREEGGRFHRRQRPLHAAGALGEPERLVARHDRGRDRRARLRGRHRAPQRRRRVRAALGAARGRVGGAGRRLDRHVERPLRPEAVLPAPDEAAAGGAAREPRSERGHDLLDRRRRPVGRRPAQRWSTRASSSWSASASSRTTTGRC